MKWFWNPCRRYRQGLCLLASGLLSEPKRTGVEKHLAECAHCRHYFEEIKAVASPLAAWEKHFAHIEPGPAVQLRLAEAFASAGKPKYNRLHTPGIVLRECWQQLVWPSRHIWAGLATVWILILAANISLQDHSQTTLAKSSPAPEILMTWQQQERLLAELVGPNELRAAPLPKPFSPQPSSQRRFKNLVT